MELRKAERRQAKLRVGVSGVSGSGKTYSALLIAKGLAGSWDKVVVIDTENGSAELFSHLGDYNVITLQAPFSPERYVEAIKTAEKAGMEAIVIDSTSHEWEGAGGCLDINEKLANTKFRGNTWAAWSETTPRHRSFLEALISSPCHIVTTARSKSDTIQTEDKKIKKVGLKEIQREGFEYELTTNFTIDREGHYAIASKDRTELFIDRDPFVISEKTGEELRRWNESGSNKTTPPSESPDKELKKLIMSELKELGHTPKVANEVRKIVLELTNLELVSENFEAIASTLTSLVANKTNDAEEVADLSREGVLSEEEINSLN